MRTQWTGYPLKLNWFIEVIIIRAYRTINPWISKFWMLIRKTDFNRIDPSDRNRCKFKIKPHYLRSIRLHSFRRIPYSIFHIPYITTEILKQKFCNDKFSLNLNSFWLPFDWIMYGVQCSLGWLFIVHVHLPFSSLIKWRTNF